jgi:hypothetical protein
MKQLLALLIFMLTIPVAAASEPILFGWRESLDPATNEKRYIFYLVPDDATKEVVEAAERGDEKTATTLSAKLPRDSWIKCVALMGELNSYPAEKIGIIIPAPCADFENPISGSIEVDWKSRSLRIALKVKSEDGKPIDFIGNGSYRIIKK